MLEETMNRRDFIGTAAVTAAAVASSAAAFAQNIPATGAMLRLGIVGIGNRAQGHLQRLTKIQDMEAAAICDLDMPKLTAAENKYQLNAQKYTSYADMLSQQDLDAVVIVTPNALHEQMTIDALHAGFHVLCEKPAAYSPSGVDRIIEAEKKSGKVVQYSTQRRHEKGHARLVELIRAGNIGTVQYIHACDFGGDLRKLYPDPAEDLVRNWRWKKNMCLSILHEMSMHMFDFTNWITDSAPVKISAFGGKAVHLQREIRDHIAMIIEYENGVKMSYGINLFSPARRNTIIIGDKGQFVHEGNRLLRRESGYHRPYGAAVKVTEEEISLPKSDMNLDQYLWFRDVLRKKKDPFPGSAETRKAVQIAWAGDLACESDRVLHAI